MYRDQFRAIWKSGLHLYFVDHIRHPVHYILFGEHFCSQRHQLHHRFPVTGAFQQFGTDIGDGFYIIQPQPPLLPLFCQFPCHMEHKFLLFLWIQPHLYSPFHEKKSGYRKRSPCIRSVALMITKRGLYRYGNRPLCLNPYFIWIA